MTALNALRPPDGLGAVGRSFNSSVDTGLRRFWGITLFGKGLPVKRVVESDGRGPAGGVGALQQGAEIAGAFGGGGLPRVNQRAQRVAEHVDAAEEEHLVFDDAPAGRSAVLVAHIGFTLRRFPPPRAQAAGAIVFPGAGMQFVAARLWTQ